MKFTQDDATPDQIAACKLIAAMTDQIDKEFEKNSVPVDTRLSVLSSCILHLLMECEDSEKMPMFMALSKALMSAMLMTPSGMSVADANLYIQRQKKESKKDDDESFPEPLSPLRH